MSSGPSAPIPSARVYTIIDRMALSYFDDSLQRVVNGRRLTVRWKGLHTFFVYVPDTLYVPEYVDKMVALEGEREDAITRLGG